jgi:EamA-like transporter family.
MLGVGALVGIHWVLFYGAIKLSNASVAVATMATTAFFAALTEPLLLKQKVKWYELALGILILPGMALIVGNISWGQKVGFAVGVLGALLAAVFSALNKKIVDSPEAPHPLAMSLTELGGGVIVCSALLPVWLWFFPETTLMPERFDWLWLMILAWVCTLLPFSLTLIAMRHISAFGANLTINLEPVYGVALAALFFQEHQDLNPWFYVGVGIILVAVFSHPFIKVHFERKP